MLFAEWNQNLYGAPYATVAGTGEVETDITTSTTLTDASATEEKPNFTTKKFVMTADEDYIQYVLDPSTNSSAYKIITFIKTNKSTPIMANIFAKGSDTQFGSSSLEISSIGWTKVETYVGGGSSTDYIASLTYTIALNRLNTEDDFPNVLFTEPEIYPITFDNYQYNALWPTDKPFTNFRPAESYVNTGSSLFSFPTDFRKVTSQIVSGYTDDVYMPTTAIIHNPSFYNVAAPTPFYKDNMINEMAAYKYYVSDTSNRSISSLYEGDGVMLNKLVLKFNTLMGVPTINISIDGTPISVDGSTSINLGLNVAKEDGGVREDAGVLVLYWNGTGWTRSRWTEMPTINSSGSITKITSANRITITQTSNTIRSSFSSYTSSYFNNDKLRMHLVEASPRVEVDLTQFLIDMSINKSMDNKSTLLPISSMNANDATFSLSSIPLGTQPNPIPIFSNQSNKSSSVLKNMLRKNIKFYAFFHLDGYHDQTNSKYVDTNALIPAGIFYSDTWSETDINQVAVQAYDITRYLQSTQVADYVCNLRSVIDIITNVLDLSGFTDYDYDSLAIACSNKNAPVDLAYYYVNSKDTTLVDALNKICLPYQIGSYIDEYGVLKFLSLATIADPITIDPEENENIIEIDDSIVQDGGYSIVNKGKPGKISVRYSVPKIRYSATSQNLDSDKVAAPSFTLLSSNDIVWAQQNADSVGMNYLNADMNEAQNYFEMDQNDVLDIFHTYNRNASGYSVIENEIVSFAYKEYSIQDPTNGPEYVYIKNDMELEAEKNRFIKKYTTGLKLGNGTEKPEEATTVTHTGKIVNVQRGMFGSKVVDHKILTSSNLSSKEILYKNLSSSYSITGNATLHSSTYSDNEFVAVTPSTGKVIFYPQYERSTVDTGSGTDYYKTYSAKFNLTDSTSKCSGGLFFNLPSSQTNAEGAYFVELVKYNTYNADGSAKNPEVFNYALAFYRIVSGSEVLLAYSDVTPVVYSILANQEKVLEKTTVNGKETYVVVSDKRYQFFNLKVATYKSTGEDGESESITNLLSIFLNNIEISGWRVASSGNWIPMPYNQETAMPKKVQYTNSINTGTIFGAFTSADPIDIPGVTYQTPLNITVGGIREIHATYKPMIERSATYYFQDREFLNGIVQNLNVFANSKSYIMQTKPEIIGINTYDVEYRTPAAINVAVEPVSYLLQYIPERGPAAQEFRQSKEVDQYAASYSTIINTGFRAKFAIANNTSHVVFLSKVPDELATARVWLNLWTTEIIANSDPDIIERIIDPANASETVQIDSQLIQSRDAAGKLLTLMSSSVDNFSKDVGLNIFGNPLIQVGDVVNLNYPLMGLKDQKYFVSSVSHDFDTGLTTKVGLNMLSGGTEY